MVASLFSYRQGNSLVHRINPAIKLLVLIVLSVLIFLQKYTAFDPYTWMRAVIFLIISFCFFIVARTPLAHLKKLRFVFILGLFITVFRIVQFDIEGSEIIFGLEFIQSLEGLLYTLRFFTASLLALVFFETTSTIALQDSLQLIQDTGAKLFPVLNKTSISLYLSLSISFIPQVFSSWQKIKKASRARNPVCCKKNTGLIRIIAVFYLEMSSLLSIMIANAVNKRKAVLNRYNPYNRNEYE